MLLYPFLEHKITGINYIVKIYFCHDNSRSDWDGNGYDNVVCLVLLLLLPQSKYEICYCQFIHNTLL